MKIKKIKKLGIRTGDNVVVNAGNYKGSLGKILSVDRKKYRAFVEGVNMVTHFVKPSEKKAKGGLEKKEASINISNLTLIDPKTKKPTKIGRKKNESGKLQRYSKITGKFI